MKWLEALDKIYVINLPHRADRRAEWDIEAEANHIPFEYWYAIGNKDGALGLKKTMRKLFERCLDEGYESVLVFEDDCIFLQSPHDIMNACLEQRKVDGDLFYLGGTLLSPAIKISNNLLHATSIYASHSVIYSRAAMETILPLLDDELPYDKILQKYIQPRGQSFFCYPMLTSQRIGESDIFKPTKEEIEANPVILQYYNEEKAIINWDSFMRRAYEANTKHL